MTNYLLDTNILLRSRDIDSPDYNLVDRTIKYLISNNHLNLRGTPATSVLRLAVRGIGGVNTRVRYPCIYQINGF
jgi:hypothetical protein